MKKAHLIFSWMVLNIFILGCNKELKVTDEDQLPLLGTIVYSSKTKIIDSTGCGLISIDSTRLTFAKNGVINTDSVKAGSILAAYPCPLAPNGYLRKVTNVSESDGKIYLSTVHAGLDEIIESCNLLDTLQLTWSAFDSLKVVDNRSLNIEFNKEYSLFGGNLKFKNTSDLKVAIPLKFQKKLFGSLTFHIGINISGSNEVSVDCITESLDKAEDEIQIGKWTTAPISLAGPIFLRFEVPINLKYELDVKGVTTASMQSSFNLNMLKKYEDGRFLPLETGKSESTEISIEAKAQLEGKLGIEADFSCYVSEIVGAKIPVGVFAELSGELGLQNSPNILLFRTCAALEAGGGIGVEAGLLGYTISSDYLYFQLFQVEKCRDMLKIETKSVENIEDGTATCGGDVSAFRSNWVDKKGICWSKTPAPTIADDFKEFSGGNGEFEVQVDNLISQTEYFTKAYCIIGGVVYYGNQVSFISGDIDTISTIRAMLENKVWTQSKTPWVVVEETPTIVEFSECCFGGSQSDYRWRFFYSIPENKVYVTGISGFNGFTIRHELLNISPTAFAISCLPGENCFPGSITNFPR